MAKKPVNTEVEAISTDPNAKRPYVVTDKAPPYVAGRRVKAGDPLELTEYEARAELQQLHILPEGDTLSPVDNGSSEPASTGA